MHFEATASVPSLYFCVFKKFKKIYTYVIGLSLFFFTSGVKMSVKGDSKVFAHPKSVNYAQTFFESKWIVYYHKLKTSKVHLRIKN